MIKKTAVTLILALLVTSCVVIDERNRPGPPPWSGPHKTIYVYHYYPSAFVYFDVNRRLYFFRVKGAWRVAPVLPPSIVIIPDEFVTIKLGVDRPYIYFDKHRKKFPPRRKHDRGGKRGKGHHY